MAEKMSTLVLKADLECTKCYNKLRRTLCEYHYEIRSQLIDRKQNTIIISGPFDPQEFAKKLNKKAGKAIKSIEPKKKEEEKPKPKEADGKSAEKKTDDKPAEKKADDKKADAKPAEKKADDKPAEKKADKPAEDKAAEKPKKVTIVEAPKSDPPAPTKAAEPGPGMKYVDPGPVLAYPMVQPYGGYTVPCYEGYVAGGPVYDGYGRPLLGYDGGYGANRGYYGNNGYNNNNIHTSYGSDYFSEKDPSCSIM